MNGNPMEQLKVIYSALGVVFLSCMLLRGLLIKLSPSSGTSSLFVVMHSFHPRICQNFICKISDCCFFPRANLQSNTFNNFCSFCSQKDRSLFGVDSAINAESVQIPMERKDIVI